MPATGVGCLGHPDAQKSGRHRRWRELQSDRASLAVADRPLGESRPTPLGGLIHGVFAGPVLYFVAARVGLGPVNPQHADALHSSQVNYHPLRVEVVIFPGESASEIGIALPERARLTIRQPRVAAFGAAVAGVAATRQRIAIGMPQKFSRLGIAGEIAALPGRVAPASIVVPVPRRDLQLRVLPVGDR